MGFLRAIVNLFLLPPGINLLLLFLGLAFLRLAPRVGRALLWTGGGTLLVLAMPVVSNALTRATGSFEVFGGVDRSVQAIVVLAAETREAPEYGGTTVGRGTLERLRLGAHLARATGLPLLLSGGALHASDAAPAADLMDRALREDFGLSARWVEGESRNTRENAQRCASILRDLGIGRVILVTHYVHMRRAVEDFDAAGIAVEPAPTGFPSPSFPNLGAAVWPRIGSLESSALALHELYGLLGRAFGFDV